MSKLDILGSLKEESKKDIKGSPLSSKNEEEPDFDNYVFSGSVSNKKQKKEEDVFDEDFFASFEEKKASKERKISSLNEEIKDEKVEEVIEEKIVEEVPVKVTTPKVEEEKKSVFESIFEQKEEVPDELKNMNRTMEKEVEVEEPVKSKPGRKRGTVIPNKVEKENKNMSEVKFSPLEKKVIKKLIERAKNEVMVKEDDLIDEEDIKYYFDKIKEIIDNM